jgi:hypothetical protein
MEKFKVWYLQDQLLSKPDKVVMVMQGWNKVLAFQAVFEEAFFMKWCLVVAEDEIRSKLLEEQHSMDEQGQDTNTTTMTLERDELMEIHWNGINQVETNQDPITLSLDTCLYDTPLCVVIDGAVHDLCPHTQAASHTAYLPLNDPVPKNAATSMILECKSLQDYFKLYARCGTICPQHWVLFAMPMWAQKTHAPYADDNDSEEMNLPSGSFARYIAAHVALPAIKASPKL